MISYYDEKEARNLVIQAGLRLLETGLIARTWGNISARISKEEMIITPSGLAYETLKPEDLVKVKVTDLSYEGQRKPSSEKGIHAISYTLRPEMRFIIHTHQFFATAVGIDGRSHGNTASAAYGLSGTQKLQSAVMQAVSQNPASSAFFLQRHGTLCLGTDYDDAFRLAETLERDCRARFMEEVFKGDIPDEIQGERGYYSVFQQISKSRILPAFVDDFAQMFGTSVKVDKTISALCNPDGDDLESSEVNGLKSGDEDARRILLEKNAAAALYAARINLSSKKKVKPLGAADAVLQHVVFVQKYSKLKK